MKKVSTERFALVGKGGQYVKPFIDDTPYLLFKTKREAEATLAMELNRSTYKVLKVRVTIEPVRTL
jgi:hypothetical protein